MSKHRNRARPNRGIQSQSCWISATPSAPSAGLQNTGVQLRIRALIVVHFGVAGALGTRFRVRGIPHVGRETRRDDTMSDPATEPTTVPAEATAEPAAEQPTAPAAAAAQAPGYAIIETGGKQYRVSVGDRLSVERLPVDAGTEITIDRVLLVANQGEVRVGTPVVAGATVTARVDDHFRGEKIVVFTYKPKKRYRRRLGHRQALSRLTITAINA